MAYLLIIDDDPDYSYALDIVLSNLGYDVQTEQDIDAGLKKMQEKPPDLLILDIMFPENNTAGLELVQSMQQKEKLKDIPILILSALGFQYLPEFGLNTMKETLLPIKDFLEKPTDLDILKHKVSELLQKKGSQGQLYEN